MNKRGGVIVESAMVFPLAVLSLTALIYMMIYFYNQLETRVDMHIALRAECGEICKNMDYGERPDDAVPVYKKAQQLCSSHVAELSGTGILRSRTKTIEARKYLIDEVKFVRMSNAAGDVVFEND